MFNPEFKNINNNLGIISECPVCKAKVAEFNVIEETDSGYLIHSKCKKCFNSVLLIALASELGINVIGMATDLSIDEFIKFRETKKVIDFDDAIWANKSLEKKEIIKNLI